MRVPDSPTSGPPAGWYTDPADAARERWWAGAEWTHDTRALQPVVAAPVAAPALVDSSFSAASFGSGDFGPQTQSITATPNWSSSGVTMQAVEPTNGTATAGLILSILGFGLIGIILSVSGLKKAREFESFGEAPVGRRRSRAGLGIGIASAVLTVAAAVLISVLWDGVYDRYMEQRAAPTTQELGDEVFIYNADGSRAIYNRAEMEQGFIDAFTASGGQPPESLACPDDIDMVVGATIPCAFSFDGVPHVVEGTFIDSSGAMTVKLDGVVVPQP